MHQHGRVPAHQPPESPFHLLVAGERRLVLHRDGVDVIGGDRGFPWYPRGGCPLGQHPQHRSRAVATTSGEEGVERLHPLGQLVGILVSCVGTGGRLGGHVVRPWSRCSDRIARVLSTTSLPLPAQQKPATPIQAWSADEAPARQMVASMSPYGRSAA